MQAIDPGGAAASPGPAPRHLPPDLAWTREIPGPQGPGYVVANSRVFVHSSGGTVLALRLDDGKVLWEVEDNQVYDLAVEGDRLVTRVDYGRNAPEEGAVLARDARDGGTIWRAPASEAGLLVVEDRVIVAPGDEIQALDIETGARVWSVPLADPLSHYRPVSDGSCVILSFNEGLRALDMATGAEVWSAEVDLTTGPTLSEGRLLVVEADRISALDARTGAVLWSRETDAYERHTVTADRSRFYLQDTERLAALDAATGEALWGGDALDGTPAAPAFGIDDRVWLVLRQSAVAVLDAETGAEVARFDHPGTCTSACAYATLGIQPPVLVDGRLVTMGSMEGATGVLAVYE